MQESRSDHFCKLMRELKKKYGTDEALGEKLGISKDAVNSYVREKNRKKPSFDVICQICDNLGASPNWLLGYYDPKCDISNEIEIDMAKKYFKKEISKIIEGYKPLRKGEKSNEIAD